MTESKAPRTVHEAFLIEWDYQRGSLMLKDENEGKEWKKTVGDFFFQQGFALGRTELEAEIQRLRDENRIMREALEFYGLASNVPTEHIARCFEDGIPAIHIVIGYIKLARETLAQLEEK